MPITNPTDEYNDTFFETVIDQGITLYSSGTSGKPKELFQPPSKIKAASRAAISLQDITKDSRVYTVQRLTHAGGLFANTIPALMVGADVTLTHNETFNPYKWVRIINEFTHSSLTPLHCKMIMSTKGFQELDLSGITIVCGAEPVTWDIIEAFVSKGCNFIPIWGMTEVGVCALYEKFEGGMSDIDRIKEYSPKGSSLVGSGKNCEYKITDHGTLAIRGDISIFGMDWYDTNDRVTIVNDTLFYTGRTNCYVDFDNPQKG